MSVGCPGHRPTPPIFAVGKPCAERYDTFNVSSHKSGFDRWAASRPAANRSSLTDKSIGSGGIVRYGTQSQKIWYVTSERL